MNDVAISDGQVIGLMAGTATIVAAAMGYAQNRYGKGIDRLGTKETRQTALETNLLSQATECNKRLDALQLQMSKMEEAHRAEMVSFSNDRRKMEMEYRSQIADLEEQIDDLRKAYIEMQDENHRLRMKMIGGSEPPVKRREIEDE